MKKALSIFLWVIGWICFFPIPLTIVLSRSKFSKTIKTITISLLWLLVIVFFATPTPPEDTTQIISENVEVQEENAINAEKNSNKNSNTKKLFVFDLTKVPNYSNKPYYILNDNVPTFKSDELKTTSYEKYSDLDSLERCGVAEACIGVDIMPTTERGSIGQVKPSGWQTVKYDNIDGQYLYNRCHLIGYQLTTENANNKNLITGTRYMNTQGMLPFENKVADYLKNHKDNHVMYRVTPIFKGENLVASGVIMEAYSVEDNGKGVQFNVYCYNVQPNITINYADGTSSSNIANMTSMNVESGITKENMPSENTQAQENTSSQSKKEVVTPVVDTPKTNTNDAVTTYILNTHTKKFHYVYCKSVKDIKEENKSTFLGTRSELISQGYAPCGNCKP